MKKGPSSPHVLRHCFAFTLQELLIALVLVAVLCIFLFSQVGSIRQKADALRCTSNQKALVTAVLAYTGDHNNTFPLYDSFPNYGNSWWRTIQPYLGFTGGTDAENAAQDKRYRCPAEKDKKVVSTYGANYRFVFNYDGQPPRHNGSIKVSHATASTFLVADCKGPIPAIYNPGWWKFSKDSDGDGILDSDSRLAGPYNCFAFRHQGAGLAGFVDGSVRQVTPKDWAMNKDGMWGPILEEP